MEQPEMHYWIPEVSQPFLVPDGRRPFKEKHALQQASITGTPSTMPHSLPLGHLLKRGVFEGETPPVIIEFGAGKAYLSSMISDCTNAQHFICIDNQAFKLKVAHGGPLWIEVG